MLKVIIIINAEVKDTGELILASPVTKTMVTNLKQAISTNSQTQLEIELVANSSLWSKSFVTPLEDHNLVYCPLTINLPEHFQFRARGIYQACEKIMARRKWAHTKLGYATAKEDSWCGNLWLPIVLTGKGPLYGEVIGEGEFPNSYTQPLDLPDKQRQPLYYLAHRLLESLSPLPSVYLLQFGWQEEKIVFDRLWPFPAAPAIASVGVQQPDLFTCYWYCLTNQPILDISILGVH